MKHPRLAALPALLLLLLAAPPTAASAAPAVDPWFAALPTGSFPSALALAADGSVFALNSGSHSVSKIAPSGEISTTFDGALPDLTLPQVIADDGAGSLYVSSRLGSGLWKLDDATGHIDATFASGVGATVDSRHPNALAVRPRGDLFVVTSDEALLEFTPSGVLVASLTLDPGAETGALQFADDGSLYAVNAGDSTVSRITFDTAGRATVEKAWATLPGTMPLDIAFDHHGLAYVVSAFGESVTTLDLSLPVGHNVVGTTSLAGSYPFSITSDARGNVYTGNLGDATISMFATDGTVTPVIATIPGSVSLVAVAADAGGSVYTANSDDNSVARVVVAPRVTSAVSLPDAQMGEPYSFTITASGLDRVHFSVSGALPFGLALDPVTGTLSGRPSPAGSFSFDVTASNIAGDSPPQHVQLVVDPPPGSTGCWFWPGSCGV